MELNVELAPNVVGPQVMDAEDVGNAQSLPFYLLADLKWWHLASQVTHVKIISKDTFTKNSATIKPASASPY